MAAPLRQPPARRSTACDVRYVRYVSPPRGRAYGSWGAWAAPPLRAPCAGLRREFAVRPRPRPLRGAGRRRRAPRRAGRAAGRLRARRRRAVGRAPRPRARAPRRGAGARPRPARARQQSPAPPSAAARSARARRRVVHLGTDLPPPAARRRARAPRRSSPSGTWSRASATPTSCARSWRCATATRPALRGRRRRPRARAARGAGRASSAWPTASSCAARCPTPRRVRAARGADAVRAAQRRRGVRRRLRRGDGGRRARDRLRAARAARRRSRRRAAACASCRPATSRRSPARSPRSSTTAPGRRELGARRAPPSSARSPGGAAGAATVAAYADALAMSDARPVLFVTDYAPPSRVGAFARAARARGRRVRAVRRQCDPRRCGPRASCRSRTLRAEPARRPRARRVAAATAPWSRGTAGRIALPAAYLGARRAGVPFVLWATLWAHPRSLAGAAGYLPLRRIYRTPTPSSPTAPTSARYVRANGAHDVFEAPQAVDNAFWAPPADAEPERSAPFQVLFVGRADGKRALGAARGLARLGLAAPMPRWSWSAAARSTRAAATRRYISAGTRRGAGAQLRNFYAGVGRCASYRRFPRATIRETWGMVVNEAMNQGIPVIATDAVGAAAGGLVRDGRNGLVVPAGDATPSPARSARPARRPALRRAARRRRARGRRAVHRPGLGGRHVARARRTSGKAG